MKQVLWIAAALLVCGWSARVMADDSDSGVNADQLFQKLDANHDGKLTASEIPQEHRKFFDRLLRVANVEKSGELTRDQFDKALKQKNEAVVDINKAGNLGIGAAGPGKFDPKRIFDQLDKNKDGKLTRDEVENRPRVKALFDRLGKDELTMDDLSSLRGGKGKPGGKAKKARKLAAAKASEASGNSPLFKLLDTNHDGKLSKEEFAKASAQFEQLDHNQDGYLDRHELLGVSSSSASEEMQAATPVMPRGKKGKGKGGAGKGRLAEMIKNADTDGDGKISMEEAPPRLKRQFAEIDTNGDGFLDSSEIAAWMRNRRAKAVTQKTETE